MLVTRRKRKEQNKVSVYLNIKTIPQLQKLKYLVIVIDYKLTFRDHRLYTNYIAQNVRN